MRKRLPVLIIFFICQSCFYEEDLPPDQQVWDYELPSDVGLSNISFFLIDDEIEIGQYDQITGLIIVKDDFLIFENHYRGSSRFQSIDLGNASLIITWAALGIALEDGLVDLNDPIANYLPEYEQIFQSDPFKNQITIENLLLHQSGISWNESIRALPDPQNDLNLMKQQADWIHYYLTKPNEAPPGLRFNYSTASGILLSKVLENASNTSFAEYIKTNILTPIEISTFTIGTDSVGNYDGGTGISMPLIDWTKFGYLILKNGLWDDRRVLDPNYIELSTNVQRAISSASNPRNVGYYWWISFPTLEPTFHIPGGAGQQLYINPDENLVIAIAAENFFNGYTNSSQLYFEIRNAINE
jgi:CubicO group peptidase (beta-lactamase class C family)